MVKFEYYKKRNLRDIQKEMVQKGELINDQTTITHSEKVIGQALIDAGIPVLPQFEIEGRSFDFKIYQYPILIEVNGSIHNTPKKRLNDAIKSRYVQRRGFKVLTFLNQEIENKRYLRKAVGEVRSTIRYCGKQPKEVHLYPLSIWEQLKMWVLKLMGKEWKKSIRIEFLK
jgi:very-short-patch-repair endonuclease